MEYLHQMRVEIKKAHSLLKLQLFSDSANQAIQHFKPVRKIFKKAGLIREAQLNLQNIDLIRVEDEKIRLLLQTNIEEGIKIFLSNTTDFGSKLEKSGKKTLKKIKEIPDKKVLAFYRTQLQKASKNFKRKLFINHLHESRKSLKVLSHIHEILPNNLFEELQINWVYVELLQQKIGNWHDMHLTECWMKKNKANKKDLKIIQKNLQEQLVEIKEIKKDFEIKALGLNGNGG
ncbi:CHAD domain-containing protein [Aquiflexum sp. TKW24L]|uniref:CHAD domain-containing protein n=1 Tax=Aquiflexum sp. TKW24L TaxID=2942212 RepID=UPI0020BF4BD2|nr:CHAD domain-containing protein [Aquiflexum sp. TKW24L]MCL6260604.1 CHAD domain-containing protein [Aquiflexum sp. TKW24L]